LQEFTRWFRSLRAAEESGASGTLFAFLRFLAA
jgi:hypothetical protein